VERDIEQHLQRLGARVLPEGDSLRVEVLDVDLAGHFEPLRFHSGSEVRIVRDITWPRYPAALHADAGGTRWSAAARSASAT
jgi:hypothetical protein